MKQEYREAFSEVNEIIKLMPEELYKKIPKSFRRMIAEEREKNYSPQIQEPLEEVELMDETKIILGLIYSKFLHEKQNEEVINENIEEITQNSATYTQTDTVDSTESIESVEEDDMQATKVLPVIRIEDIMNENIQKDNNKEETETLQLVPVKKEGLVRSIIKFVKRLFSRKEKAEKGYGEVS